MIKLIAMTKTATIPTRATDGAAGYDLCADEQLSIAPGDRALVKTGISTEFADKVCGLIISRSGAAIRGIDVCGGLIDSDYRGEIKVILHNHGDLDLSIMPGDRIANLVFTPILTSAIEWSGTVSETERGADGFGSTGI